MDGQQYVVRAIPAPGHEKRFRIGRAWGKGPVTVKVVDNPAPPRVSRDRDGREFVAHSDEISPVQLAALLADVRFAVTPVGDGETDANTVNELKVKILKLEEQLSAARLAHQGEIEDMKREHARVSAAAEESAAHGRKLVQELADAKAQLNEKRSKAK